MLRTRSPRKEKISNCYLHSNSLSNKMDNSLLAVRDINHKYIVVGNEGWVYNDNVNDPKIKKWLGEVVGKEGEDLTRHDKWLCMMYPRLKLLQKLLADDGVIFISIDDTECSNLILICNEIFGASNFVANVSWQRTYSPRNDSKGVADGLFCREIDGLFCRSSPDIIVRRRCVLSHKRRGWLQPSPSFRYSRNLALQDELYHPVINNGPAVLVCVDKRLGTGPVNQSRDAG